MKTILIQLFIVIGNRIGKGKQTVTGGSHKKRTQNFGIMKLIIPVKQKFWQSSLKILNTKTIFYML